ncbi:adenylate/guanylate cyclase domain-containing protein [Roseofilum reptotaenium CS-1145]|uniref:Adenylate/guanylate cyclase domain-containing protein n=1 Tax=Roseofilum reptotaenium AO1-A TaxID=1925591 RepID=A0A1L9QLC7_9CYAN|nr:adenylate/guanylate cyclase domain-containing protein [Roseofilum reptotaenium]MDB9516816.1 adenylate/guanylate cyclase domain-containing protein [Roseofilum reptotaenium CS-1145]OJJ18997.1 adenylate/guanylate cyclase domain-containing protein [Roseofilum reptotaenium AO1-A]
MWKKIQQNWEEWRGVILISPSIALAVIGLRMFGVFQLLEWAALDQFFRWRPIEPMDERIVIVGITESDIQQMQKWPLSDRVLTQLIEKIQSQHPRAIGLDLYRDLPVEPGYQQFVEVARNTPNLIGIAKIEGDRLGESVASSPVLEELNQVSAADLILDGDGKIRRMLLSVRDSGGKTFYGLGTRLALDYLQDEGVKLEMLDAHRGKVGLGKAIFSPLQPNDGGYVNADTGGYQIMLNFRSRFCLLSQQPCQLFETVTLSDVLDDRLPPNLMRDRIVLIGGKAASLNDRFITPFGYSFQEGGIRSGVELHADLASHIISAALDGRPQIQFWSEIEEGLWIGFWSTWGAILGWIFLRIRWKMISVFFCSFGLTLITYGAFLLGWWLPVFPPLVALFGAAISITAYIGLLERHNRQTIMHLFERHVTPKIAQAVWRDRHQLLNEGKLTGRKLTATVLFTDLQGFTTISESIDPETLMVWLNQYMNAMVNIVLNHDGVVDKFIGDAVMAVFGVPIPSNTPEAIAQDAQLAVQCAVEMGKKLRSLNRAWKASGLPTVAMRVGIATGEVVAGSLGSDQRMNYTTIGDSVNVAARLESYDKTLDGGLCRILISEETYEKIKGQFPTQAIGSVSLKGRTAPVKIYQVIGSR